MAAYAAAVCLKSAFSKFLHYYDAALPPEFLNTFERVVKELKSLMGFIERLDSRSRMRMSARITVELDESRESIMKHGGDDEFLKIAHCLIETLKKMQKELLEMVEGFPSSSSTSPSTMIGLRDERSKLKEALVDFHLVKETVFLLHGMAGIGKTTLACEVYEDLDISEWFECRAWVTLGNQWKSKEITEVILKQVDPDAHRMVMGGDEEEIAQRLKESLKLGKRCLIVADDLWNYEIFQKYMEKVLLHGIEGNRVVLTSRIRYSPDSCRWYVFGMRLMTKKESWDLLREKVFRGVGTCPPQLVDAGKKIADKCDGLPLTIITVAEFLSEYEQSLWIDVAEKKKHQLFIDAYHQISKVLYPSYKMLQDGIKKDFLYLGVFPLKYKIHRSRLVNLWIAEGISNHFVKGFSSYNSLLHVLVYFDDCSLVMAHKISSTYVYDSGQAIKTCRLNSSWWHLIQTEARKTNFFYVLDCPEDALEEGIKGQSRLSFHNNVLFARKDVYNSIEENCASTAQSLLCFGPYHQYMVPLCFGLKFLQRLDALNIRFYDFPLEVLELAELMYLALTCNRQLPPSVSKLKKLQYLIVHPHLSIKSCEAPTYMPMEIWDLEELKHLEVLGNDLPDPGDKSLEMLSTLLGVSTASCTVLNKLPNLEKLRIKIVSAPEAPADPLCCFDHISNLEKIEALICIVVNPVFKFQDVPPIASFPILPNMLQKLSLSGLGYPWEEIRKIVSLKGLRVLKLQLNAFHGKIWEVKELDFPDLRFLLIQDLDLVELKQGSGGFKVLHHLIIKHCYKLKDIQLEDSIKSWSIEVVDSNPLVEKSIKRIMLEKTHIPEHISVHSSWKSTPARSAF